MEILVQPSARYDTIGSVMRTLTFSLFFVLTLAAHLFAQDAKKPDPMRPDPNMPRPIDAYDSVFLEELTWLEVRDALRAGTTP